MIFLPHFSVWAIIRGHALDIGIILIPCCSNNLFVNWLLLKLPSLVTCRSHFLLLTKTRQGESLSQSNFPRHHHHVWPQHSSPASSPSPCSQLMNDTSNSQNYDLLFIANRFLYFLLLDFYIYMLLPGQALTAGRSPHHSFNVTIVIQK